MPRQPRLHLPGAFYHVMARGNRKQYIFKEKEDYITYLRLMRHYSQRYNVEVHGYALMPNHVHMLLKMGETPLAKFMQGLQQTYTQYFNKEQQLVGHVFQGRYKSIYVDTDEYLLDLIRYIHLNPVKAGLVDEPTKYTWSSCKSYFYNVQSFIKTGFIKQLLAAYGGTVIDDYQLMSESIPRPESSAEAGQFSARVLKETVEVSSPEKCPRHPSMLQHSLEDIMDRLCLDLDVQPELVLGTGRGSRAVLARRLFAYLACRQAGHRLRDVARYLGCSEVTTSKSVKWVEQHKGSGLNFLKLTT
ncbi:transposase [Desulfoscipio gibsoniae]|uniref:Transposase n=1 Tax=Desulfoscipio gibsoniae DSM 7213 TaxID=767817 RepID=R4KSK5_9FIRM|nr:transposase [Desulfoscipio gibsoniae]AGL03555.1 transposase [Desulfoscipio gibsoniae DSM 7213]